MPVSTRVHPMSPASRRHSTLRRKYKPTSVRKTGLSMAHKQDDWVVSRRLWAMFTTQQSIEAPSAARGRSSRTTANKASNMGTSLLRQLYVAATGQPPSGASASCRHRKLLRRMRTKYSKTGVELRSKTNQSKQGNLQKSATLRAEKGCDTKNEVSRETALKQRSGAESEPRVSTYNSIGWAIVGSTVAEPISFAGLSPLGDCDTNQMGAANRRQIRTVERHLSRSSSICVSPGTKVRKRSVKCHASDYLARKRSTKILHKFPKDASLPVPASTSIERPEIAIAQPSSEEESVPKSQTFTNAITNLVSRSPKASKRASQWYVDRASTPELSGECSCESEVEEHNTQSSGSSAIEAKRLGGPKPKLEKRKVYLRISTSLLGMKARNDFQNNGTITVEESVTPCPRKQSLSQCRSNDERSLEKSASVSDLTIKSSPLSGQKRGASQWMLVRKISGMLSTEKEPQASAGRARVVYHSPESERFYAALALDINESTQPRKRAMTVTYAPHPTPNTKMDAFRSKSVNDGSEEGVSTRQLPAGTEMSNAQMSEKESFQHRNRRKSNWFGGKKTSPNNHGGPKKSECESRSGSEQYNPQECHHSQDFPSKTFARKTPSIDASNLKCGRKLHRQAAVNVSDDELVERSSNVYSGKSNKHHRPRDWRIYKQISNIFQRNSSKVCKKCDTTSMGECACSQNGGIHVDLCADNERVICIDDPSYTLDSSSFYSHPLSDDQHFHPTHQNKTSSGKLKTAAYSVASSHVTPDKRCECDTISHKKHRRSKPKEWHIYRKISSTLQNMSPKSRRAPPEVSRTSEPEQSPNQTSTSDVCTNGRASLEGSKSCLRRPSRKVSQRASLTKPQRPDRGSRKKSVKRYRALKWSTYQRLYSRIDKKLHGTEKASADVVIPLHYKCIEPRNKEYDVSYKVIVLGECGVGKTAMMQALDGRPFVSVKIPSQEADYVERIFHVDGARIQLAIWNLPEMDVPQKLTREQHRSTKGIVLVFDVTKRATYKRVGDWVDCIHKNKNRNVPVMIVGNKCDCDGREGRVARAVTTTEGIKTCGQYECDGFHETSAKTGSNIDEMFGELAYSITCLNHAHLLDGMMSLDAYKNKYDDLQESSCETTCASQHIQKSSRTPKPHRKSSLS